MRLNLLSFNTSLIPFVRHPYKRIKLFAKQSGFIEADILNLQEVHTYDMLWKLRRSLPAFSHVSFQPGLFGPKAGLVGFSKMPFANTSFTSFSHQKGVLISELTTGTVVANVHLIANTDGDWSAQNRFYSQHKAQLDQLNKLLARSEYQEKNSILSGDFNLAKTSDLYNYFINAGGWHDTAKDNFAPTFHAAFLPKDRKPQRIDYIFTRGSFITVNSLCVFERQAYGHYLSNHMGLFVKLSSK